MNILSDTQIKQADAHTIRNQNITSEALMESAANKVFQWIRENYSSNSIEAVMLFCGPGNNGGDGLAVGRMLYEADYNIKVFILDFEKNSSPDFDSNLQKLEARNIPVYRILSETDFPEIGENTLVVDSIFGVGLNRTPNSWVKKLIQYLNSSKGIKISIDMPSGLFANAPVTDFNAVVKSSVILTSQSPKFSIFLPKNAEVIQHVEVLNIKLDADFIQSLTPLAKLITLSEVTQLIKNRKKFSHKGTYGHVAVIGGRHGMIGAASLTSKAAYRAGAGK